MARQAGTSDMPVRPKGMPLAVPITLALIVKIVILMLHKAFFSAPQAKKMRMPTPAVEQHLLGSGRAAPVTESTSVSANKVQP
jgi:hypothetical protein